MDELHLWLLEAARLSETDAFKCAQRLHANGCRSKDDVYLLAEAGQLPAEIPIVMRLKIERLFK